MLTFPVGVPTRISGVTCLYEERLHINGGMCQGPACPFCTLYRNVWKQAEAVEDRRKKDELTAFARSIKPYPRYKYVCDQGEFYCGKYLHEEFKRKGPAVCVLKKLIYARHDGPFAQYDVSKN